MRLKDIFKRRRPKTIKRPDHSLKLTAEEKKDISKTIRCYNSFKPFRMLHTAIDDTPINKQLKGENK